MYILKKWYYNYNCDEQSLIEKVTMYIDQSRPLRFQIITYLWQYVYTNIFIPATTTSKWNNQLFSFQWPPTKQKVKTSILTSNTLPIDGKSWVFDKCTGLVSWSSKNDNGISNVHFLRLKQRQMISIQSFQWYVQKKNRMLHTVQELNQPSIYEIWKIHIYAWFLFH